MEISSSKRCDLICDYIPVVSTVSNIARTFQKICYKTDKQWARILFLIFIPVISNLVLFIIDHYFTTVASHKASVETDAGWKTKIFYETLDCCEKKSYPTGGVLRTALPDWQSLSEVSAVYGNDVQLIPHQNQFTTKITVTAEDTFDAVLRVQREESGSVAALNMANRDVPGGSTRQGAPAQEEELCRRSDLYNQLVPLPYPLPEFGGVYSPNVSIFRKSGDAGYAFLDSPKQVAIISVAADNWGNILRGHIKRVETRIRNLFTTLVNNGAQNLVLGALGCGVFRNDPKVVSEAFKKVLEEPSFKTAFKTITFAILVKCDNDQRNLDSFQATFSPPQ